LTLVLETTVSRLYAFFVPGPHSLEVNLVFFAVAIVIFSCVHVLILLDLKKQIKSLFPSARNWLGVIFRCVMIIQFVLNALLIAVLYETTVKLSYTTSLITIIICVSYLSGIANLSILSERFIKWILNNRNRISMLFGISTLSILVNTIFTLLFVVEVLLTQPSEIKWHIGSMSPDMSPSLSNFEMLYSTSFTISYLLTWIATVFVLKSYSSRLGNRKFWLLATLPLLFLIGQFQTFLLPLFYQFRLHEPVAFTVTYTVIFAMLKVSGAIFFGVGFWSLGKKIERESVKRFLSMSSYGLILIFVSNQAILLIAYLFPPLGLTAVCFVGLSLLAGTYSTAVSVANDIELHKSIRRSVKEFEFLDNIGHAEMEFEIRKKVFSSMNVSSSQLLWPR
ncbi:MAG: hypothetical protein WBY28_09405, partial [Nitrososphaeraceae archaeon]